MQNEQRYIREMDQDRRESVQAIRAPVLAQPNLATTSCSDCDNLPRHPRAGDCHFDGYPEQKRHIQVQRAGHLPHPTVPEFMDRMGLARNTLLHSDIQGYEEDMLKGAAKLLAGRRIDWIVVSTHGKRHCPCHDNLTWSGYRIVPEHDLAESASMDGLLVAQNPDLPEIPSNRISLVDGLVTTHARG